MATSDMLGKVNVGLRRRATESRPSKAKFVRLQVILRDDEYGGRERFQHNRCGGGGWRCGGDSGKLGMDKGGSDAGMTEILWWQEVWTVLWIAGWQRECGVIE